MGWGDIFMNDNVNQIRTNYLKNPPNGYSSSDIEHMSDDDLLDLDYFINEDFSNVSPLGISLFVAFILPSAL